MAAGTPRLHRAGDGAPESCNEGTVATLTVDGRYNPGHPGGPGAELVRFRVLLGPLPAEITFWPCSAIRACRCPGRRRSPYCTLEAKPFCSTRNTNQAQLAWRSWRSQVETRRDISAQCEPVGIGAAAWGSQSVLISHAPNDTVISLPAPAIAPSCFSIRLASRPSCTPAGNWMRAVPACPLLS
jgi:hypothetical protein